MNNDPQKQTRRVLIAVAVVGAVAIIGGLGFVLLSRDPAPNNSDTAQTISNQTQGYETNTYSFQPPKDGWAVSEVKYGTDIVPTARVTTEKGVEAEVGIYTSAAEQALAELRSEVASGGDAQNIVDTEVAGVPGFTYTSSFEGVRYHTVFIKDDRVYDIIYRFTGEGQAGKYIDGYNDIISSFSFK